MPLLNLNTKNHQYYQFFPPLIKYTTCRSQNSRSCVAFRLGLLQVKYILARTIIHYEVYKSKKTQIKYIGTPMALTYDELLIGFNKRN